MGLPVLKRFCYLNFNRFVCFPFVRGGEVKLSHIIYYKSRGLIIFFVWVVSCSLEFKYN